MAVNLGFPIQTSLRIYKEPSLDGTLVYSRKSSFEISKMGLLSGRKNDNAPPTNTAGIFP